MNDKPLVYFTRAITPESLVKVYEALGWTPEGPVAVKISTGEPPASHPLAADLIGPLVRRVQGTIVECNTAYGTARSSLAPHLQLAKWRGYTAIAGVDILDGTEDMALPVTGGTHLKENYVGAHLADYRSCLVLSHFKGHVRAGYGGAIKNLSIGLASSRGKHWIHTAGTSWEGFDAPTQDDFLESMAEAAKSVSDFFGGGARLACVNVLNFLSVDCDCNGHPAPPEMADLGIAASLDPVACDQAALDLVYAAPKSAALVARVESRHGQHTLEAAEALGLGSRTYRLVEL